jgi:hypothetical protein
MHPAPQPNRTSTSRARTQANRQNAARSTGPRTPAGKHTASLNALRHGLTGRTVVLPSEDLELYRAFCQRFASDLDPSGVLEQSLVQTIADSAWRLDRAAALEANLLSLDLAQNLGTLNLDANAETTAALTQASGIPDTSVQLVRLSLYSQRISRLLQSTLAQLRQLQAERRIREAAAMKQAVELRQFHQAHGDLWQPADPGDPSEPVIAVPGFEFSLEEIDAHIEMQTLLEDAHDYALHGD